jgi:hypothetical protein
VRLTREPRAEVNLHRFISTPTDTSEDTSVRLGCRAGLRWDTWDRRSRYDPSIYVRGDVA